MPRTYNNRMDVLRPTHLFYLHPHELSLLKTQTFLQVVRPIRPNYPTMKPQDTVWVQESWRVIGSTNPMGSAQRGSVWLKVEYKDGSVRACKPTPQSDAKIHLEYDRPTFRSGSKMPVWASRYTLRIIRSNTCKLQSTPPTHRPPQFLEDVDFFEYWNLHYRKGWDYRLDPEVLMLDFSTDLGI
jgi:hypothetical protein